MESLPFWPTAIGVLLGVVMPLVVDVWFWLTGNDLLEIRNEYRFGD